MQKNPQQAQPIQPAQMMPQPVSPTDALVRGARFLQMITAFGAGGIVLLFFILLFETLLPFDAKPSVVLGRAMGTYEAVVMATKEEAEKEYRYALAEAQQMADRTTEAYRTLYERALRMVELSNQMKSSILDAQIDATRGAQVGQQVVAIFADIACEYSRYDPTAWQGRQQCGRGAHIRQQMRSELGDAIREALRYADLVNEQIITADIPDPATMRVINDEQFANFPISN